MIKNFLDISHEVKAGLKKNKPIIALESTIISHGMPFPENLKIANELESIAKQYGVIPATICVLDGKIKIGLCKKELKILAENKNVKKVTRRNLPETLVRGETGATTVAATMIGAKAAGIKVFATGGIGGVHRNAGTTFDISADLKELTQTSVIVISAGIKAILDITKTLELLETLGVPVYAYKTSEFPAFYSQKSGLNIARIDSVEAIVNILQCQEKLGFKNGILLANPIPAKAEIPFEKMKSTINKALIKADKNNITGPRITPFLLQTIVKQTKGQALKANIELVKNNVKLACKISKAYQKSTK